MRKLWLMLLPELERFPASEQVQALEKARKTDLDIVELLGVAAGLVIVTAVTQYALPNAAISQRVAAILLNFIIALPLMAGVVAPFHVRRLRRGLRAQMEPHRQHE